MDAVEKVMRKDGYAQLSARKIADAASLNYQLVFYYFETIEDLLLETYKRRTRRLLKRYDKALNADEPFQALLELANNRTDGLLSVEYMAMSNHYPSIREESVRHVGKITELMNTKLPDRMRLKSFQIDQFSPTTIAWLISSIGNYISFQQSQGIGGQAPEIMAIVHKLIENLEVPDNPGA